MRSDARAQVLARKIRSEVADEIVGRVNAPAVLAEAEAWAWHALQRNGAPTFWTVRAHKTDDVALGLVIACEFCGVLHTKPHRWPRLARWWAQNRPRPSWPGRREC